MTQLNSHGEVADFVDTSQFIAGRSAYECVAYSASLVYYCGRPGHGPAGSAMQTSNLAQYWYGREEGSNAASNENGMSLDAEYNMLQGLGLTYHPLAASVAGVKEALTQGYPVLLCGAETGMYDLGLGDRVPYAWKPSGNHCIVASGIASDGNLLVHDCASIGPSGVRPGPRTYDVSKLEIVSATAVIPSWQEENVIDINSPNVANFFEETDAEHWKCKSNGNIVQYGILSFYKQNNGLLLFGLPLSNEVELDANGNVRQFYERGCLIYDPKHVYDNPPGSGNVYTAHVYADKALGEDPLIPKLEAQIAQLQAQLSDPTDAAKLAQLKTLIQQASTILV